jgi:hypothetical protein
MVAQTPQKRNHEQAVSVEKHWPDMQAQMDVLRQWVCQSAQDGTAAHEVERGLFERLLALGSTLFRAFLTLVGPGDFGETVTLDDGRVVRRCQEQHRRRLLTVFGEFFVSRWVYAQREKAKVEFAPTDQRLQLPASDVSYLLQEWDQLLGVEQAFGQVREVINTILRVRQSVDTLEHTNQQMAEAAPLFREVQDPVDLAKEGELYLVTAQPGKYSERLELRVTRGWSMAMVPSTLGRCFAPPRRRCHAGNRRPSAFAVCRSESLSS